MTRVVVLDSGPLGLLAIPPDDREALRCEQWFRGLVATDVDFAVPEIINYELRRELIRLAAQTQLLIDDGHDAIVATTNVRHLTLFVPAAEWATVTA